MDSQVLTLNQVAARASITRRSLERLIAQGAGPAVISAAPASSWHSGKRLSGLAALAPTPGSE